MAQALTFQHATCQAAMKQWKLTKEKRAAVDSNPYLKVAGAAAGVAGAVMLYVFQKLMAAPAPAPAPAAPPKEEPKKAVEAATPEQRDPSPLRKARVSDGALYMPKTDAAEQLIAPESGRSSESRGYSSGGRR